MGIKKFLFASLLLVGCNQPKVYKVEFNSGNIYTVKSTGYFEGESFIGFNGKAGIFPKDSVKSITIK